VKMANLRRETAEHEEQLHGQAELDHQKLRASEEQLAETGRLYRELQNREAKIRGLVDANIVGIFIWDLGGQILEANDAFLRIVGYEREDLVSGRLRWTDLTPPEWLDLDERQWVPELKMSGSLQPFEKQYFRKDGSRVPVFIGVTSFEETGNQGVAFVLDLTERKHTEALLSGEKRILEMVAKGASLSEILDSICRLVEEQASGVLASILLVEDGRVRHGGAPSLPAAYTDAIDGAAIGPSAGSCGTAAYLGKQVIVEDIATDPLWSNYRDVALPHSLRACWSTPIFSPERKVIATFAMYYREPRSPNQHDQEIIQQITHLAGVAIQRKLTEAKLQRSEAYLAEAQRLSHTGTWAFNATSTLYWSEESYRIWGFDPQQDLPKRETVWQRIHPDDRDKVNEETQEALHEKRDYAIEFRIVLPDGAVKYLEATGRHLFSARGELVEVVGTYVDVTERKRAQEEHERLRQVESDLAHINRVATMGQLSASIAHEINQPIAAVITNANAGLRWLSAREPDLGEVGQALGRIIRDGNRAAEVINGIRALAKKVPPRRDPLHVNQAVREVIAITHPEMQRNGVTLQSRLADRLPVVLADRVQLQQVVTNLIVNAIEAMGGISDRPRELTILSGTDDAKDVFVEVQDTGPGLDQEQLDRLFQSFYTTKPDGIGMGLAISRSIAEAHGGRLSAAPNQPRGAGFRLTLPVGGTLSPGRN
jgi:PAS domain S-box-containing protein